MQRMTAVGVLGLMGLVTSPLSFSQSTPAQAPTQTQPESRDRLLDDALTDIALLKRVVREQDRRIADLEKALRTQQAAGAAERPPVLDDKVKVPPKPIVAPWHNPQAWASVEEGMSRAQVEDILGKPTSVDAVIDYQTLNYKGDTPGGGVLTGSVKLTDDRVTAVSPPDF
ncbi:MAG TPA: outer membrane protein assembly factor BamE [Bryobacteraceae bacterium]|nr:outer membrane protein assembly factor BamE [Bryobacteraceae bacterium]